MNYINEDKLILEKEVFTREEIEKRMKEGGFNSLAKFELYVWELEMFLQLQEILRDKIILKGGAATQFYIPITGQRTSIDIDMICLASREEVHQSLRQVEDEFNGEGEYCKFRLYEPRNPKVGLGALETYFVTIPSVCNAKELYATKGRQEVKIEFLFQMEITKLIKLDNRNCLHWKRKENLIF
ncbi:MAG: nucleotidyl transferase AbiEii/AbiGii toxin family protein [Desulfosporosinus sp.]